MKKSLVVISTLACLQAPALSASCPSGTIMGSDAKTVMLTTGNWEGEEQQLCQWRDGQEKTFCPTFTSRDWGRDVLSKQGKWIPFSNDKLPAHKAKGWDTENVFKTFYDPNRNVVVKMRETRIRRGNPAVTSKYIQLIYSVVKSYPCEKVSF